MARILQQIYNKAKEMPDITMCSGNNCQLASLCYRYKAEPSKYMQSYFTTPPNDGLECDYFWEIKTKEYERF